MKNVLLSTFCTCGAMTLHVSDKRGDAFCPTCGSLLRQMEPTAIRRLLNDNFHGEMHEYLTKAYEQFGLLTPSLRLVAADDTAAPPAEPDHPTARPHIDAIDAEFDYSPPVDVRLSSPEIPLDQEPPDFATIRAAWCGETWEQDTRTASSHAETHLFVQRDGRLASNLPDDGAAGWRLVLTQGGSVLHLVARRRVVGLARSIDEILGPDGPCTLEQLIAQHGGPCVSDQEVWKSQRDAGQSWHVRTAPQTGDAP